MKTKLVLELQTVTNGINFGWIDSERHWPNEEYIIKLLYHFAPKCSLWDKSEFNGIDISDLNLSI